MTSKQWILAIAIVAGIAMVAVGIVTAAVVAAVVLETILNGWP